MSRSRAGNLWVVAVVSAAVLLLILVFVLQNGQRVQVSYFGARGTLPMGVALLLAAVLGVLLVAIPGTIRILQLRMAGRRRPKQPPATLPDEPLATRPDEPPVTPRDEPPAAPPSASPDHRTGRP